MTFLQNVISIIVTKSIAWEKLFPLPWGFSPDFCFIIHEFRPPLEERAKHTKECLECCCCCCCYQCNAMMMFVKRKARQSIIPGLSACLSCSTELLTLFLTVIIIIIVIVFIIIIIFDINIVIILISLSSLPHHQHYKKISLLSESSLKCWRYIKWWFH